MDLWLSPRSTSSGWDTNLRRCIVGHTHMFAAMVRMLIMQIQMLQQQHCLFFEEHEHINTNIKISRVDAVTQINSGFSNIKIIMVIL